MRFTCMICGWEGTESELISRHLPATTGHTDESVEYSCPQCGNELGLRWVWDNPEREAEMKVRGFNGIGLVSHNVTA